MPRPPRIFVDGAIYHVYCRVGRGEPVFRDEEEAEAFTAILDGVKRRDGFTLFAWCVMSTHYHLALRTARVPLWRSMRLIQGRFAKAYNRRHETYGPLWQGRYKASVVRDGAHLRQVIAYIHMNPVRAGVVNDPGAYPLSGHGAVIRHDIDRMVDVDEALLAFGETREAGLRGYISALKGAGHSNPVAGGPEGLPWWKEAVRSSPLELLDVPRLDALGMSNEPDRPSHSAETLLAAAAEILGHTPGQLAGPRSGHDLTRARELFALLAVEQYRIRVKDLAQLLSREPSAVSRWISTAGRRRATSGVFRDRFDRFAASVRAQQSAVGVQPPDQSEFVTGVDTTFVD